MPALYAAEISRTAADIIRMRGLAKGELIDCKNQVCASGALLIALGGSDYDTLTQATQILLWDALGPQHTYTRERIAFDEILAIANLLIRKIVPVSSFRYESLVVAYNNHPATAPQDVIRLLDQTATEIERGR